MSEKLSPAWQLVAEREITTKLRDKTFIGSTVVMLVLVIASIVIPSMIDGNSTDKIAVTDDLGGLVVQRADRADDSDTFEVRRVADRAEAERLVRDGDVAAALLPDGDGYGLVGGDGIDSSVQSGLREAYTAERMEQNAAGAGLSPDRLRAGTELGEQLLDPGPIPQVVSNLVRIALALVFYMTALGFGIMIAQSVVQEKESRVVEILAAAVPIRSLLWGKVLGNAALALGQILVIAVTGLLGLALTGEGAILNVVAPAGGWFVVFFVLGFIALAGLWAVAGSLATRQDDLQSTTLPGQMLLMVPFFFSVFAGDDARAVASFVPIASSMSMPGRMLTEDVALWQPLLSIAILLATTVLVVRIGARLYERTLLQTGRRMGYREAMAARGS